MKVSFMNFYFSLSKKCMQQSDSEEGVKTPLKCIIVWTQSRNAEISNNEKNRILTETNEYWMHLYYINAYIGIYNGANRV